MIDLHMHTTFSDGSATPEEIIIMASEAGLKAIAITDHDNIRSYVHALEAAANKELEVIPGIEINTWWQDHEVHILGYYFDPESKYIKEICEEHNLARRDQIGHILFLMRKYVDIQLTLDEIQAFSRSGGTIGRPHVAKAIVEKGGAINITEAFRKFLVPTAPTYYRRKTVTPHEAVEAIYESGGISVIAHPADMEIVEELATDLMNYGLCGIEAYHRSHSSVEIEFHCSLAERLGLIVTGGTDFHGTVDLYPQSFGRLHMPDWVYSELRKEKQRIDKKSIKVS